MPEPEAPKIIIDTDWKSQARAEKERLSEATAPPPKPAPPSAAPGAPTEAGEAHEHPQPTFDELIRMLATQALLYLGAFPDPETGRAVVALDLAKFNIDLLGVLEAKTRGNLTEQEASMLQRTAYELRMQFVEISRAVAKAVQEGRVSRVPAPGAPAPPKA
jgi:hypothetical protein